MSWTEENNYNMTEAEKDKVALGLKDVENELSKNNKLVQALRKEQKDYNEQLLNKHRETLTKEIQVLTSQKTKDLEDLASEFSRQVTLNAQKNVEQYFATIEEQLKLNIDRKSAQVDALNLDIERTEEELRRLKTELEQYKINAKNKKQKEFLQEFMLVIGAIIASIGVLLLVFAFSSALYSFDWHSIWTWQALDLSFNAPTWQKALFIILKVLLSVTFFLVGVVVMFLPLMAFQKFLQAIHYKYHGFAGRLNKFFNK